MSKTVGEVGTSLEKLIPITSGAAQILCREMVCNMYMTLREVEELGRTIFTRVTSCEAKTKPMSRMPAWKIGVDKFREAEGQVSVIEHYKFWVVSGSNATRTKF